MTRFLQHPIIAGKECKRMPGEGFVYNGKKLMGITQFLTTYYYPIFSATRRNASRAVKRGLGLRMGTVADSAVTAFAKTGDFRKMARSKTATRLVNYLHKLNLQIVDAHVLICDPILGIATEIDVLCQNSSSLVVIENKTTLQTRAEHERTYRKPDLNCPLMLRGFHSLLNNEYNHHQLQLASMIFMLRRTYGITASGHVLVASSDSLNHYPMNPTILNLAFSVWNAQSIFCPVIIKPAFPQIRSSMRAFLLPRTPIDPIPAELLKLQEKHQMPILVNYATGNVSYYDREGERPCFVDFAIDTPECLYLYNVVSTVYSLKEMQSPASALVKGVAKLPNRQINCFLNMHYLNLAVATHALKKEKKIEARLLILGPKKILRLLPRKFLKL